MRAAARQPERKNDWGIEPQPGGRCTPSPRHSLVCGLIDHAIPIVKEATPVSHVETMHAACQTGPGIDFEQESAITRSKHNHNFDPY